MTKNTLKARALFIQLSAALPTLLLLVLGISFTSIPARASAPNRHPAGFTSIAAAPGGGFWIQRDQDHGPATIAVGGAPQYESVADTGTIVAIPGRNAYWVVSVKGKIYVRGGAPQLCDGDLKTCSGWDGGLNNKRITAAAASPNGTGLWAVDNQGHVWTAGDVISYGDVTNDSWTPTAIVSTPSGFGYYILLEDGGVYTFGDAVFFGSTGGARPGGHYLTGLALSLDLLGKVNGYWMLADDGAIYTYGDAPFLGNSGPYFSFATCLTAQPGGHSYAWVHANAAYGLSMTLPKVVIRSDRYQTVWSVPGQNKEIGVPLQTMDRNDSTSQQWMLWPTTSDGKIVQIVNVNSGLCADITERNIYPFHYLIQYPCKGKTEEWNNQRFTIISDVAGQHFQFLPVTPGNSVVLGSPAYSQLYLIQYQGGWPTSWSLDAVK